MLAEIQAADILSGNKALITLMDSLRQKKIDYIPIFTGTPDDTFVKSELVPWIRITPIPGDTVLYSDDQRMIEYPRIQVDFWVREADYDQIEELQELIMEALEDSNYSRYYVNRYSDPDLDGCVMVTANFEGFFERND